MYNTYKQALPSFEHWELAKGDEDYPEQLTNIGQEPPRLYGVGNKEALKAPLISIIGARKATPYGLACAQMAGRIAAECGITVVSGGAIGCDAAAGRAALDAGGKTIVVPGTGPDVLYPRSSDKLFYDAVMHGGCVVTNTKWETPPLRGCFVSRNTIIAALSRSLIVCEAGIKSGTSITAAKAAELGKRIYAVPGSIFSPTSQGTNHLLQDGASIICDEQSLEILISLDYELLRLVSEHQHIERDKLIAALAASPMNVGEIASYLTLSNAETFALIADYEAAGLISRQLDGKYAASSSVLLSG